MSKNWLIYILFFLVGCVEAEQRTNIADTAEEVNPLLVGHSVPDIPVWTDGGKPVSLAKMASEKPLVVIFYRGGWCPFCNHQLSEIRNIEGDLNKMGYEVVAISPELPDTIKRMKNERDISFTMLSDHRLEAARAFGIAFRVDAVISTLIEERYDSKLQRYQGESKDNLPVPAVFVVDKDGVIQFSYVNPNYQVRLHPELLMKAAEVALKGENVRLKR